MTIPVVKNDWDKTNDAITQALDIASIAQDGEDGLAIALYISETLLDERQRTGEASYISGS